MKKWEFAFDNARLSQNLQEKLDKVGLLPPIPETNLTGDVRFIKDYFTPDGFPHMAAGVKVGEVNFPFLFPAIAPWYDGAGIPAGLLEMEPLYRQTACKAALSWLNTLIEEAEPTGPIEKATQTFHGLAFQESVADATYTFAFPDTRVDTDSHGPAAVVLIADSYMNNCDWEKQSGAPLYARQQAMFQLWCWDKFAEKSGNLVAAPKTAFIVRISGNLAVDCTIRSVAYNEAEAAALVNRICKARMREPQRGTYWKRNIVPFQTWAEKISNEAYITEDADLYALIEQYMKKRKERKAVEKELNDVTARRDAIAVQLASRIPAGDLQGYMDLADGSKCSVSHQPKRPQSSSISPDVIRSFFGAYDACIIATGSVRETVNVDVL